MNKQSTNARVKRFNSILSSKFNGSVSLTQTFKLCILAGCTSIYSSIALILHSPSALCTRTVLTQVCSHVCGGVGLLLSISIAGNLISAVYIWRRRKGKEFRSDGRARAPTQLKLGELIIMWLNIMSLSNVALRGKHSIRGSFYWTVVRILNS